MATRVEREKRRAARLRRTTKVKQELEELLKESEPEEGEETEEAIDELDLEEEAEEEPVAKEKVEKDMGYDGPMATYMPGPTSWDEHDALRDAREKAEQIREVSYTVQDLVSNIVISNMSPDEKSKAIKAVGDGFGARLKTVEDEAPMKKELDLDLLEVEALIAKDNRRLSISEKVADWFSKAKLTASAESALSDADFALVVTRDGKKVRKYPIHDKAHVRNALARAAQMIKKGGEAAADAKAALSKIHAAAKKMGIGMMEKEGGILIEKDASGSWRWVGWPTNNFIDHSNDIITEAAHIDYVDWVNKDIAENAPVFTSCHAPGTARTYPVDFAAYENGFVVMSGKLTEDEAVSLLKASAKCDIGMSHTAYGLRDVADPRQIIKYRSYEVTDLPVETADNPFTFMELSKEVDMNQLEYLTNLLGSKEKAEKALKLKTGMKQKELQDAGVESKEKAAAAQPAPETKTEKVDVEAIAKQVFERVSKELDMEGLSAYLTTLQENSEKVPVLEALVKELSGDQDEKLAEMIEPPAGKTLVWQKARASQSQETVLNKDDTEDEKLSKAKPEVGWLSELSGTAPIQL